MKVDFYISSLSSGGAEHVLTNLAANFAEHDMDVSITSYDIYLAHHIYILGPLSILSLQISAFSKIIILIGLISAQSIIVHKASALLNQLKISD